jgi:hypothetical protein
MCRKNPFIHLKTMIVLGVTAFALLVEIPEGRAQSQSLEPMSWVEPLVVPSPLLAPPLSVAKAQFFEQNPAAWNQFLARLPRRAAGLPQPTAQPMSAPLAGGTWQSPCCTSFFPSNPLLLTDGTVIAHAGSSADWYKLTPDVTGSYVNGTWSQIASLPVINGTQYAPLYFASAVLPDGRVIIVGGEYNNNVGDHTTMGAIYDPLADTWTAVAPPSGAAWFAIGDAQSAVLADGTFMLAACCAGSPTADALFDATTLGWAATGGPSNTFAYSYQDEQGYTLLPNGNVLTTDIWDAYPNGNTTQAEQYVPSSGTWISAGNTPVFLADPHQCGNWEVGPAVLRPDGTVVAFGGNTGCVSGHTADPIAIYNSTAGTWSRGRNVPALCGSDGTTNCSLADAPAALLPSGNILFAASAGAGSQPTHFFEFTSSDAINQVADTVFCAGQEPAYAVNFLVLPNGQILATDLCNAPEFYTPTGSANASWAPAISSAPSIVVAGSTYAISGTQFNGLSQGAYYGDDVQGATNYPLVRITNSATGHVFYGRTANHSTMSVAPGASGATNFTVPENVEAGASYLVVVANGIASKRESVTVMGATTTALGSSQNPSAFGQSVMLTAMVSSSSGTPTGKVTFKNGSANLGTVALAGGAAALTSTTLSVGTKSITAVYDGSALFAGSTSSALTQVVNKATSTVTLTSSANPSTSGQSVTFTATAHPQFSGTPTDKVTFKDGSATLATVTLAGGAATFTTSSLSSGAHTITARYGGSADFVASSATLKQTVD